MMPNYYQTQSAYGLSRTRSFSDIFPKVDDFSAFYNSCGIPPSLNTSLSVSTIYYLLLARYSNSTIMSSDENRFKYELMSIIFQYGPTWEKKLELQKYLRNININSTDWLEGTRQVLNVSQNPATDPSSDAFQVLDTINAQNMSMVRKGKLEGIGILADLLEEDVTGIFLSKFKRLFRSFTQPQLPLLYATPEED